MNLQKIERLIEKYEQGSTSFEEENELKKYFSREAVPLHLRSCKDLFTFLGEAKKEELANLDFDHKILETIENDKSISISMSNRRRIYTVLSIAASFVILFGLYFQFRGHGIKVQDSFDDPEIAYAVTKRALLLVSGNLNKGVGEMERMSEFNSNVKRLGNISSFNEGINSLEKISVLDESKEIITSKKQ